VKKKSEIRHVTAKQKNGVFGIADAMCGFHVLQTNDNVPAIVLCHIRGIAKTGMTECQVGRHGTVLAVHFAIGNGAGYGAFLADRLVREKILSQTFLRAVGAIESAQPGRVFEKQIGQIIMFRENDAIGGLANWALERRPIGTVCLNHHVNSTMLANQVTVLA